MISPEALKSYVLGHSYLPLAPRQIFCRHSETALAAAIELSKTFPEKRGVLSHVVRQSAVSSSAREQEPTITFEAHFDSVAISDELADELLKLGFEPDGFAQFNPEHYAEHFTLKFKCGFETEAQRRRFLWETISAKCEVLAAFVSAHHPSLECYIEREVYGSANRRTWEGGDLRDGWKEAFPLTVGTRAAIVPPNTPSEAKRMSVSIEAVKHADIHLKVARGTVRNRNELITQLAQVGFYHVVTWAGNDVCTGQFQSRRHARAAFFALGDFFGKYCGCTEMTFELVPKVWRSLWKSRSEERYAALPPLILDDSRK